MLSSPRESPFGNKRNLHPCPGARGAAVADSGGILPLKKALEEPEREIILRALETNHGSRQATAEALGINRTTLYKKMKRYGIEMAKSVA